MSNLYRPAQARPRHCRRDGATGQVFEPQTVLELDDASETQDTVWLYCCACRQGITPVDAAIERAGAHAHHFVNPAGLEFEIGCFARAPGCLPAGATTLAHTWFPGYAWQVALCRACGIHLGWSYRNTSEHFFGLILAHLCGAGPSSH